MADTKESSGASSRPPLAASAAVLLLFYILVTVSGHADTDLIRPDTQISLQGAALPSGWILTPFLGLKLSVLWFYAFAPLVVLALHFELLRGPTKADDESWTAMLRLAGNVMAPAALFLLLWKFAPYSHARPPDVSTLSVGRLLSYWHAAALFADAALVLYGGLEFFTAAGATTSARSKKLRVVRLALVAIGEIAVFAVLALTLSILTKTVITPKLPLSSFAPMIGLSETGLTIGLAILVGAIAWLFLLLIQMTPAIARKLTLFGRSTTSTEVIPMSRYVLLLTVLLVGSVLPGLGRPLNLTDARLAAAEPSDTIVAAMIGSRRADQDAAQARLDAWANFGRGFDYTNWQFVSASFDGATMPLIRLDGANLTGASLVRANLSKAFLIGTTLDGTNFIEADLRGADLSCANSKESCSRLAQAQKGPPPQTQQPQTQQTQAPQDQAPASNRKACDGRNKGPILNKAIFEKATMIEANLSDANLPGAIFQGVKDVTGAKFTNANLRGANLMGVEFTNADLAGACLCGADLQNADLRKSVLAGASLRGAELKGAKLPINLDGIDFEGANIKDTIFIIPPETEAPNLKNTSLNRVVQVDNFAPKCLLPENAPQGAAR